MANQILAGAVFQAGQIIAGVDADNPPITVGTSPAPAPAPSPQLALTTEEHYNAWVKTNTQNSGGAWKPSYDGYIHSSSSRNGGYHPAEHGPTGQGTVSYYTEIEVVPNQQYTVTTNTWFWAAGGFVNGQTGSMVRLVDMADESNDVVVIMDPPAGGSASSSLDSKWTLASETFTSTGNMVRVELLAPAGEQYIESITLTES